MGNKVKAVPDGANTVTPYLIVKGAADAITFYQKAFDATEISRMNKDENTIGHAEIRIGSSVVMLADEFPEMNAKCPQAYGGSPISMHLYVEDVDKIFNQAVAAGAKVAKPLENQFFGDRTGAVTDPFGYYWHIASHIEDVSDEEICRRFAALQNK